MWSSYYNKFNEFSETDEKNQFNYPKNHNVEKAYSNLNLINTIYLLSISSSIKSLHFSLWFLFVLCVLNSYLSTYRLQFCKWIENAHLLVITDEYIKHGAAKTQLKNQIISRNILAFFLDVRCCNGLTIAKYLKWSINYIRPTYISFIDPNRD
jgi:hypothetical protein